MSKMLILKTDQGQGDAPDFLMLGMSRQELRRVASHIRKARHLSRSVLSLNIEAARPVYAADWSWLSEHNPHYASGQTLYLPLPDPEVGEASANYTPIRALWVIDRDFATLQTQEKHGPQHYQSLPLSLIDLEQLAS